MPAKSALLREFSARKKDGAEFPVEVATSEVAVEDQRLFTVILRDLTRRKRTERTLTSYNERLEALRLKSIKPFSRRSPQRPLPRLPSGIFCK